MLVLYRQADGGSVEAALDRLSVDDVVAGRPVREFRWHRGQRHYSGWYHSSTTGSLIAYESRLELARILLADFDRDVVGLAAQPFLLTGPDGPGVRRHVPDLLLVHGDGLVRVVDVKAGSRVDEAKVQAQFSWTREVCALRGWAYETWCGADPVMLENVRFLAGYRRSELVQAELGPLVVEAAAEQSTVGGIEMALADRYSCEAVRPIVLNLLWRGVLIADLSRPLAMSTSVRVAE